MRLVLLLCLCTALLLVPRVEGDVKVACLSIVGGPRDPSGNAALRTLHTAQADIVALEMRTNSTEATSSDSSLAELVEAWADPVLWKAYNYKIIVAPKPVHPNAKAATAIIFKPKLKAMDHGAWPSKVHTVQNVYATFARDGGAPPLFVLSVAFPRSHSTGTDAAQQVVSQVMHYLKASGQSAATMPVAVAGALNAGSTFSEITDAFNAAGIGNEIMPPVDQHGNSNTNRRRDQRNHFILASNWLGDYEVPTRVGEVSATYDFGTVFDPRVLHPLPMPSQSTDGHVLGSMLVLRQFAVDLVEEIPPGQRTCTADVGHAEL